MVDLLTDIAQNHRSSLLAFLRRLAKLERFFLLSSDLEDQYQTFLEEGDHEELAQTDFGEIIRSAQEAVVRPPQILFALRQEIGVWVYCSVLIDSGTVRPLPVSEFLREKELLVETSQTREHNVLELDLGPFARGFPRIGKKKNIGRGVEFLNRHLSGRLFNSNGRGEELLLDFLRLHQFRGTQLMLSRSISTSKQLNRALDRAETLLAKLDGETHWDEIEPKMRSLGFEPGWGNTAGRVLETIGLLGDIFEGPTPDNLQAFLVRVPMIFSVAILSPHGYFGQSGVLGLPDTGGQVVYILDQVQALEKEMRQRMELSGLDIEPQVVVITRMIPEAGETSCNQRREPIHGTESARILRVPFRRENGEVIGHWISRFKIWPYLEEFAREAETDLIAELGGRPDLVIGNYSDGNLVASLMAQSMGVTQCNIAHALEKTKYLYSALYWKHNEENYHFSAQFTADLIAMNYADFIITSTYQEIAGTGDVPGQYESYQSFTMPGLYRVVDGVDVFDPKFNIVSPGADEEIYFPYSEKERRFEELRETLENYLHKPDEPELRGNFVDPDKPVLFLMSRLDAIKNVSGFVEWFGRNERLRQQTNLFVAAGSINPAESKDIEEIHQIQRMHELIDEYDLEGQIRWRGGIDKRYGAEMYRMVADTRGAFVQPALFEAFGLTVIEAMSCGLPTFATRYGGPLEIIVDGKSGFHIDPNRGDASADKIADFFERCRKEPQHWDQISKGSVRRVQERYTWRLYASRLMDLSRIYGFWKYMTNLERAETRRYLEMFYALMMRRRASKIDD